MRIQTNGAKSMLRTFRCCCTDLRRRSTGSVGSVSPNASPNSKRKRLRNSNFAVQMAEAERVRRIEEEEYFKWQEKNREGKTYRMGCRGNRTRA